MAHHQHTPPPIIMHTPYGRLKFRQTFTYNAPVNLPGPDINLGHISFVDDGDEGHTVILPPVPRDDIQDVIERRADAPAPTILLGQEGRMVKDPNTDPVPIVESPTTSDSTAGIWQRGKVFAGKIKF